MRPDDITTQPDPKFPEFGEWQPIETAPKGKIIIGLEGQNIEKTWFGTYVEADHSGKPITGDEVSSWWYHSFGMQIRWIPTHWMPLPEPPEES